MTSVVDIPPCEISNGFLGTKKVPKKVILAPIECIYQRIRERYDAKERRENWWNNFTYETKDKQEVMVIETHQGNTIVDTILTANCNQCDNIVFLGFCGGLHPKMKIGDITIATGSYLENEDAIYIPKLDLPKVKSAFPNSFSGINLTVESVLRETAAIKTRRPDYLREGTISVDQETAYIYREAKAPSASVMLVTDLPSRKTLFEPLNRLEKKRLENGVEKLVDYSSDLMESL